MSDSPDPHDSNLRSTIEELPGEGESLADASPIGFDAPLSLASSEWSRASQLFGAATLASNPDVSTEVLDEADLIGVPRMKAIGTEESRDLQAIRAVASQYLEPGSRPEDNDDAIRSLWNDLKTSGDPELAFALSVAHLDSRNELTRVAAACALSPFTSGNTRQLESVMMESVYSPSLSISRMAIIGLSHLNSGSISDALFDPGELTPSKHSRVKEHTTSIAVHGTFARLTNDNSWFLPASSQANLHGYLRTNVSTNLFADPEWYYRWEGGYSEQSRQRAAEHLHHWMNEFSFSELDTVYAHSHGGNVVLNALANGTRVKLLVLLHVPPLVRSNKEWESIRQNVEQVIVMRSRFDMTMVADSVLRTRRPSLDFDQKLLPHHPIRPNPQRKELRFKHDLFLDPEVWREYRLDREIRYQLRFKT